MRFKLLLFDLDNTLIDFDHAQQLALKKTMLEYKVNYTKELDASFKKINHKLWKRFEKKLISKNDVFVQRFQDLFSQNKSFDYDKMSKSYIHFLGEKPIFEQGAQSLLESLKSYPCGIITNGHHLTQKRKFKQLNLEKYFDFMMISDEVGVGKPNPKIFEEALKKFGLPVKKEQVLMIGDNIFADINGAKKFGLKACWYNPAQKVGPTNIKPDIEIKQLTELLKYL